MNQKKVKATYFVKGMHCAACESLIEKTIEDDTGILKVKASLGAKKVEIEAKDDKSVPTAEQLNTEFKDLGYKFYTKDIADVHENSSKSNEMFTALLIAAFAFVLLLMFEEIGVISNVNVTNSSPLFSFFVFGLVAGASSCAALVGGLLLSLSAQWNSMYKNETQRKTPFVLFNFGRLVGFFILGAMLGVLGGFLTVSQTAASVLAIIVSLIMIGLGLQMLQVKWASGFKLTLPKSAVKYISNEANFKGKYMPFLVGFLTFFMPCGFTLIAQTNALEAGNALKSGLIMLAFALGTLPMLGLISFSSVKLYSNNKYSRIFNFTAGILVILFALNTLKAQATVLNIGNFSGNTTTGAKPNTQNSGQTADSPSESFQTMHTEARGFEYTPSEIHLKANVPVKWEFYNYGATGCAQSVAARGLFKGYVTLKSGLNKFEFTPENKGVYKLSCSMGMVPPVTVYVE